MVKLKLRLHPGGGTLRQLQGWWDVEVGEKQIGL